MVITLTTRFTAIRTKEVLNNFLRSYYSSYVTEGQVSGVSDNGDVNDTINRLLHPRKLDTENVGAHM